MTEPNATKKCLLETEGYHVVFEFRRLETTVPAARLVTEFVLDVSDHPMAIKSVPTIVDMSDPLDLANYLEEHISLLLIDPGHVSDYFVSQELGFEIQAQEGIIRPDDWGTFSLRFMANVWSPDQVFIGGECGVSVAKARKFAASLRAVASALDSAPHDEPGHGGSAQPAPAR
jgi:hypothetical protein